MTFGRNITRFKFAKVSLITRITIASLLLGSKAMRICSQLPLTQLRSSSYGRPRNLIIPRARRT